MRPLVIGGCGVLGSWVVRDLLEQGDAPVVFDVRDDRSLLREMAERVPIELGDITDLDAVLRVLERHQITHIANLGALMPDACTADPYRGFQINTFGALNVMEAARRAHVQRVVFASSKSVVGKLAAPFCHPEYAPVTTDQPPNPYDVYGESKWAAEIMLRRIAEREDGPSLVALRFATTYGPGKTTRHGTLGILSRIIEGAFRGESVLVASGLDQCHDFVYCRDIAQAVVRGLKQAPPGHHLVQIGSGQVIGMREILDIIRRQIPDSRVSIGPGLDSSDYGPGIHFRFDIQPARQLLGYEPQYNMEKGIADYLRFLRQPSP